MDDKFKINLAKEPKVSCALGICKRVVSVFAMSWKSQSRRELTVAQLQEEPGQKVKKLVSVSK